jgi:hypothetical protein
LGINSSDLIINEATIKTKSNGIRAISIPCNGKLKFVFGNAFVKEDSRVEFFSAYSFKYVTNLNYEALTEALNNKNYTGKLEIKMNKDFDILVSVNQGKFAEASGRSNQTAFTCRGGVGSDQWVQDVADCASWRIDHMNWWDYTWCVVQIVECWAQTVGSCIVDGCIPQEP